MSSDELYRSTIPQDAARFMSNDMIKYELPESTKPFVIERKTIVYQSYGGQTYTIKNPQIIEFNIPADDLAMTPREAYFTFQIKPSDANARIKGSIKRMFSKLEIESFQNNNLLESIDYLNFCEEALADCTISPETFKRSGQLEGHAEGLGEFRYSPLTVDVKSTKEEVKTAAGGGAGDLARTVTNTVIDKYETPEYKKWMNTTDGRTYTVHFHSSGLLTSDRYLHMRALGGLKIKLTLEKDTVFNAGGDYDWTITNARFVAPFVRFADKIQGAIVEAAAAGKLEFSYDSWYNTRSEPYSSSPVSLDVRKGLSNVKMILASKKATVAANTATRDSFISEPYGFKNYEVKVGGLSYPGRPCDTPAFALTELHKAFGYWNNIHANSITYEQFTRAWNANEPGAVGLNYKTGVETDAAGADTGNAIGTTRTGILQTDLNLIQFQGVLAPKHYIACDFESDPMSNFTGISTKNGNIINFNYEWLGADYRPSRFDVFLLYTKILRITAIGSCQIYE